MPVTPRSGLRRTSRLGVTAAPRTCSRYLPWGGGIFRPPAPTRLCPFALPTSTLCRARMHKHTKHTLSFFLLCIGVDDSSIIRVIFAALRPLLFSHASLLFSLLPVRPPARTDGPTRLCPFCRAPHTQHTLSTPAPTIHATVSSSVRSLLSSSAVRTHVCGAGFRLEPSSSPTPPPPPPPSLSALGTRALLSLNALLQPVSSRSQDLTFTLTIHSPFTSLFFFTIFPLSRFPSICQR